MEQPLSIRELSEQLKTMNQDLPLLITCPRCGPNYILTIMSVGEPRVIHMLKSEAERIGFYPKFSSWGLINLNQYIE